MKLENIMLQSIIITFILNCHGVKILFVRSVLKFADNSMEIKQ